jgi:hypothetical protein
MTDGSDDMSEAYGRSRLTNAEVAELEAEVERLREALEFYAEEDSEPEVGGVDGGKTALAALASDITALPSRGER